MADLFAPKLQSEVAYERPVETPSMLSALAGVGEVFAKSYGGMLADRAAGADRGTAKTDPNLSAFTQGLQRVEAIRQDKGETAALVAERQLATNFAMQGIDFGTEYQKTYEATTGRTWAGYGRDNEAFMMEQTLNDPQVQASYTASYAINQDWTEEQRIEYAVGQKATLQAAADTIARSKSEAVYKWSIQTEAAYGTAVDTFLGTNFGALVQNAKQGGRVGPQALANLDAQWAQLKVTLTRPTGVAEEQWKSTQEKIANVDGMLATLTKAASSDVLFEEITTAFANSLLTEGGGDINSVVAAATAIKDPTSLANLMGGNMEAFVMSVGKSIKLDVTTPDFFGHILNQGGAVTSTTGTGSVILDDLPPSIKSKVEGKSPQQYFDGLKASGQLTGLIDTNSLQRPDGRQQFTENAIGIGAVLMSMNNDQFLSASFLKELIGNPNFVKNIKTLDGVDPESATSARVAVRSGLNVELGRQQRNLAAIEGTLFVKWDEVAKAYSLDREAIISSGKTPEQADRFIQWVGQTYGGSVRSLADGTKPLPADLPFNPGGMAQAFDRRDAIGVINNSLYALATEEEQLAMDTRAALAPQPEARRGFKLPEEVQADAPFLSAVDQVATRVGVNPNDLLRVIEFETAGSWSPAVKNPNSSATGLIQFLDSTAKSLGTTTEALAKMNRSEQMGYVQKYLNQYKGRIRNFGDLYMAIHYPSGIGKGETFVMYEQGSPEYAANTNLDTNGDGTVTRGETIASVMARTGTGMATTPRTAASEQLLAPDAVLTPPASATPTAQATGVVSSQVAPTTQAPDMVAADATLPEQATTATRTYDTVQPDQGILDTINTLGADPADVKVFDTDAELKDAATRGEVSLMDLVVVNGRLMSVTRKMIGQQ